MFEVDPGCDGGGVGWGEEEDAAGRIGVALDRDACRGFPLVYINEYRYKCEIQNPLTITDRSLNLMNH